MAAKDIPTKLIIIGDGEQLSYLKGKYQAKHIKFIGYQAKEKVFEIVSKAKFTVLPSICYENNPFSIIESHCLGTPVLGANIGGIPELIIENENGMLYEAGNIRELKYKITQCLELFEESNSTEIARIARERYSADVYYSKINQIYGE
jgi:glycosyltransferase involved in cell wall biosynthesis